MNEATPHIREAVDSLSQCLASIRTAWDNTIDESITIELEIYETALTEQRRMLEELLRIAEKNEAEERRIAEKYVWNRYGRIEKQPDVFWKMLVTHTLELYGDPRFLHYWIYGAMHRPMSETWARLDRVRYYNAVNEFFQIGVHTWVVCSRPLTQEEIDRYELTPAATVSWEK